MHSQPTAVVQRVVTREHFAENGKPAINNGGGSKHHHHHHHSHSKSGSVSDSRLVRIVRMLRSCACCRASRKRCFAFVCILILLLALTIVLTIRSGVDVRSPLPFPDAEILHDLLLPRVKCVDLEKEQQKGDIALFGGGALGEKLSRNHVCEVRDAVLEWRMTSNNVNTGVVDPAILIPIDKQAFMSRWRERLHAEFVLKREANAKKQLKGVVPEDGGDAHAEVEKSVERVIRDEYHTRAPWASVFGWYLRTCFQYPHSIFGSKFHSCATTQIAPRGSGAVLGTVVLYAPHYGFQHPVHSMENLGPLIASLDTLLLPPDAPAESSSSSTTCHSSSMRCIARLHSIVVGTKTALDESLLPFACLRAALVAALVRAGHTEAQALQVPIQHVRYRPAILGPLTVERLVTPGALYDLFADSAQGERFRKDLYRYLTVILPRHQTAPPSGSVATVPPLAAAKPKRKVVYVSRMNALRRVMKKEDAFVKLLQRVAEACSATVSTIKAGAMTAVELAAQLGDAQVMIGLHGADLGNMLLLGSANTDLPSAVVEVQPPFFVEPRFLQMSRKLSASANMHYHSLNCGSVSCAGDVPAFRELLQITEVEYSDTTHKLTAKGKKPELSCVWPSAGYLGDEHGSAELKACWKLLHDTTLIEHLYGRIREADVDYVTTERARQALVGVMLDAFASVGWFDGAASAREQIIAKVAKGDL